MTDIFDRASEREQLERDLAIRFSSKVNALPYKGACYFCGEAATRAPALLRQFLPG